ncbi:hypothetical protein Poli38472_001859 [Pythium oligandrum]|uniref:Uncharacterized protein n=1 Tax=Pythium oligandrum TaxID=41045 RepID=A0A8K1FTL4_PYTOL|nr:hypothetical protein Poli38472_001859 [Pythium oligandrum]|eukprot:TMW69703.1 hypothetical protein Poli38472_001859 [Pythium oligandrum]
MSSTVVVETPPKPLEAVEVNGSDVVSPSAPVAVEDAKTTEEEVEMEDSKTASESEDGEVEPMDLETEKTDGETNGEAASASAPSYTVRRAEDDARALELAKRRLQIQIAFVENARKKLEEESHPDFVARLGKLEEDRDRLLDRAKIQEAYWQHCTSVIFDYECEEASSEYLLNCDKLRQDMLDEIQNEIEILNDQRKGSSSARKTTRKTRSTRTKPGSEEKTASLESAHRIKKRVGNVFQQLENRLAQSEVDHDLRELGNLLDSANKKRRMDVIYPNDLPYVAKYHRSTFLYRDEVFQEGDEILVRNFMTGVDYAAVLCAITSTELFVLSEKGKYSRLVLMDLRQGRVVVSALTPDQIAALNEREEREALLSP